MCAEICGISVAVSPFFDVPASIQRALSAYSTNRTSLCRVQTITVPVPVPEYTRFMIRRLGGQIFTSLPSLLKGERTVHC
jgi:hypothetical protein